MRIRRGKAKKKLTSPTHSSSPRVVSRLGGGRVGGKDTKCNDHSSTGPATGLFDGPKSHFTLGLRSGPGLVLYAVPVSAHVRDRRDTEARRGVGRPLALHGNRVGCHAETPARKIGSPQGRKTEVDRDSQTKGGKSPTLSRLHNGRRMATSLSVPLCPFAHGFGGPLRVCVSKWCPTGVTPTFGVTTVSGVRRA